MIQTNKKACLKNCTSSKNIKQKYYTIIKKQNGVTLITLATTIVVLLILAGISISIVFGNQGIVNKTLEAAEATNEAVTKEQSDISKLASMLDDIESSEEVLVADGSYSKKKQVNTPKLGTEMTAIKWDENANAWIKVDETKDDSWYDYSTTSKQWANAVVGGSFNSDGTLIEDNNYSMFVWIPRYAYQIISGYHKSGTDINSDDGTLGAGEINIKFLKGTTNTAADGTSSWDNVSGQGKWNIHPAFNYGSAVSGIWVAKFEASHSDATSSSDGSSTTLKVQPVVRSWRYITISDMYEICTGYNSNLNSHMMKNDEWGAVAYLAKSSYGKNSEVWINPNKNYITGQAGTSVSAIGTSTTYEYSDKQYGINASTTGTIYGIYDMSGGSWEYVAAYVNNENDSLTNYGSNLVNGNTKNKNVYSIGSSDIMADNYSANSGIYGDAVYETSSTCYETSSWFSDYSRFPNTCVPFFLRGGGYDYKTSVGLFCFAVSYGIDNYYTSFRPVLIVI